MMSAPEISIKFVTDDVGNPKVIPHDELEHFKIEVSIINVPHDVYAVNYQLHPSYLVPFREERNKEENFKFTTTAYGDFNLVASLLGRNRNYLAATLISQALASQYREVTSNDNIMAAIEKIKAK